MSTGFVAVAVPLGMTVAAAVVETGTMAELERDRCVALLLDRGELHGVGLGGGRFDLDDRLDQWQHDRDRIGHHRDDLLLGEQLVDPRGQPLGHVVDAPDRVEV